MSNFTSYDYGPLRDEDGRVVVSMSKSEAQSISTALEVLTGGNHATFTHSLLLAFADHLRMAKPYEDKDGRR